MRRARVAASLPSLIVALTCTACIAMPAARSAETRPGPTVELSNSVAFAPGGTSRCVLSKPFFECSELLVGGSVGMTYGWISAGRPAGRALGAGLSAADGRILPYLDYYQQQRAGESPRGLGARVATSIGGWTEVQAYARVDHWLASGRVITWNPAIIAMTGRKDDFTAGTFVGLSNSIGLLTPRRRSALVPSLTLVVGRGHGDHRVGQNARRFGPEWAVFGGVGMTYTFPARRRAR